MQPSSLQLRLDADAAASDAGKSDIWDNYMPYKEVSLDVLLPNGFALPMKVSKYDTLAQVKVSVWKEAKKFVGDRVYLMLMKMSSQCDVGELFEDERASQKKLKIRPLFSLLLPCSDYIFITIGLAGVNEEQYDERRRVCDLRMFMPVVRLVEPKGNREEKELAHDIGCAIGRPLCEFEDSADPLVTATRLRLLACVSRVVRRRRCTSTGIDMYCFPTEVLLPQEEIPKEPQGAEAVYPIDVWMGSVPSGSTESSPNNSPPPPANRHQRNTLSAGELTFKTNRRGPAAGGPVRKYTAGPVLTPDVSQPNSGAATPIEVHPSVSRAVNQVPRSMSMSKAYRRKLSPAPTPQLRTYSESTPTKPAAVACRGQKVTVAARPWQLTPRSLITAAVAERVQSPERRDVDPDVAWTDEELERHADRYFLKVAGLTLYLLEEMPLIRYKYVRECVRQELPCVFMLMCRRALVERSRADWRLLKPTYVKRWAAANAKQDHRARRRKEPSFDGGGPGDAAAAPSSAADGRAGVEEDSDTELLGALADSDEQDAIGEDAEPPAGGRPAERPPVPPAERNVLTLWELDSGHFRIKINSAGYINIADVHAIYVKVALYHGADLISARDSKRVAPANPRWNEVLNFDDVYMQDIPRSTQVCFSICSVRLRKNKEDHCALAWVNVRLFDHRQRLITGVHTFHMWSFQKGFDGFVNPLGHNGPNPERDTSRLEVEFEGFEKPVVFPGPRQIHDYVNFVNKWRVKQEPQLAATDPQKASASDKSFVSSVLRRGQVVLADQQRRADLWRLREYCMRHAPDVLPRLLHTVNWADRAYVAQMYVLLERWPLVVPDVALELLDHTNPDRSVRAYAVRALDANLCDDRLTLYLMSLVQVLRYEAFHASELARLLLRRALCNQRVGHMFFWLLRAELATCPQGVYTRFGLLLEAFCRGCGPYLQSLLKQVDATEQLDQLSLQVKECRDDEQRLFARELRDRAAALEEFESPLDSAQLLGKLRLHECRVLGSAKRPLWLCWVNADPLATLAEPTYEIIFKNGDDLRQDMLTLQVLRIMDTIWRSEGLDLCLTPYACLPMGRHIGMIQVIKRAKTVREVLGSLSSRDTLHKWIQARNVTPERYAQAVRRFTQSCAGYSVATFVLGIKDRHPDNIMVTEDGRIFHIDFGHFLGHEKRKLGINRDRVPFVLTDSFVSVIARGADVGRRSLECEQFESLCVEAYLLLHKHARLFISLFTMMLCMGIPELQKLDDVKFLHRTLAVDSDEKEAQRYFCEQFDMAYKHSWMTSLNWLAHNARWARWAAGSSAAQPPPPPPPSHAAQQGGTMSPGAAGPNSLVHSSDSHHLLATPNVQSPAQRKISAPPPQSASLGNR